MPLPLRLAGRASVSPIVLSVWTIFVVVGLGPVPAAAQSVDDARTPVGIFDGCMWDADALGSYVQTLASRPFRPTEPMPAAFAGMDYDAYRMIRFNPVKTLFRAEKLPMQMEVYHRGYIYPEDVKLYVIEPSGDAALPFRTVREVPFRPELFEYRGRASGLPHDPEYSRAAGYAGFNIIGHLPSSEWMQEVFSFIGSSYFRGLSDGQVYGSSCRGLAIDIGMNQDEEFPAFRAFWIEKPAKDAKSITVHALLDSWCCAGVYSFEITPGDPTTALVKARLHFRHLVSKVGLAPISSMWVWGQGFPGPESDPRPEVHDTDGLLVHADSAWIWRPITRQPHPSVTRTLATRIQGFGLMQRQRDAAAYNDDEARYVDRPSTWIEPLAGWTPGAVELMEFPTEFEGMDNIAAWYNAEGLFPSGQADPTRPIAFTYRVSFLTGSPVDHELAKATAFEVDRSIAAGQMTGAVASESVPTDGREGPKATDGSATPDATSDGGDSGQPPVQILLEFTGSSLDGVQAADITPQVDAIRASISDVKVEIGGETSAPTDETADSIDQKKSAGETNTAGKPGSKAAANSSRVRISFLAKPTTPYNYELRATLFETRPASPKRSKESADSKTDRPDDTTSKTSAAADAGEKRLLSETWSYLCPPQP